MAHPKQRVLLIYWGRRGGGAQCFEMMLRAFKENPNVDLHCSYSLGAENKAEIESLGIPSLPIETYASLQAALWRTLRIGGLRGRLARYLRDNRIDAVVSVMPHLWSWLVADVFAKTGVAYFPIVHDAAPHPGDITFLWRTRMETDLSHATGVFTFSKYVGDSIVHEYGVPSERVVPLQLGPTTLPSQPVPTRRYPTDRPFRLMFFGRLLAYKGLDLLIGAFERLKAGNLNVELWIVGDGDLEIEISAANAPFVNIERRWIPDPEVSKYMFFGDLLVLPYIEASQSGMVATARSHGLPIVATPVGGLKDQVNEDVGGMLAPSATAHDLADTIGKVVTFPKIYETLAMKAHESSRGLAVWIRTTSDILRALGSFSKNKNS
jgi:glycosyltransferase involved in cell wall biosynthesis